MHDSNVLITGANGQLGKALQVIYPEARAVDRDELDVADDSVVKNFDWADVEVIINAAGYTNVDGAETDEGRVAAWAANAVGVANLAALSLEKSLTLVHISTDSVFDCTKSPHAEDEPLSPLSSYGASKAAGDVAITLAPKHYLLRASWVIGDGKNFARTMLELGKKGVNPSVVADQVGRPTFTANLAKAVDHLLKTKAAYGTYNASNDGEPVGWADFTRAVFKEAGLDNQVTDTTTSEYFKDKPNAAPRPLNSVFDLAKIKAAGFMSRDWHEDLADYIKEELSK